jgi:putative phage-type endonuclease
VNIVHTPREQWLLRRRELITASDCAAILGLDPHRRPSDVYLEKIGARVVEETDPMKWGRRLESAIAEGYRDETGRAVLAPRDPFWIDVHPSIPWLGATLDREAQATDAEAVPAPAEGVGVLELKASSDAAAWEDEPPIAYQVQLTIQMACRSRAWGSLAAFLSLYRPVAWVDRVFDKELFDLFVPLLDAFRLAVSKRTPPIEDPNWFSRAAIRLLWPSDTGESIPLTWDAMEFVDAWEAAKAAEAAANKKKEAAEDALRILLRDATTGFLPDGTSLNLKTTPATWVEAYPKKAFRVLRRFRPRGLKPNRKEVTRVEGLPQETEEGRAVEGTEEGNEG